jgi:hypothetical protein
VDHFTARGFKSLLPDKGEVSAGRKHRANEPANLHRFPLVASWQLQVLGSQDHGSESSVKNRNVIPRFQVSTPIFVLATVCEREGLLETAQT